jgi:uncharacterized protein (DUF58 family)
MTKTPRAKIAGLIILLASLAVAAGYAVDRWQGAFYIALIAFLLAVSGCLFGRCTESPQEKNARQAHKGNR